MKHGSSLQPSSDLWPWAPGAWGRQQIEQKTAKVQPVLSAELDAAESYTEMGVCVFVGGSNTQERSSAFMLDVKDLSVRCGSDG